MLESLQDLNVGATNMRQKSYYQYLHNLHDAAHCVPADADYVILFRIDYFSDCSNCVRLANNTVFTVAGLAQSLFAAMNESRSRGTVLLLGRAPGCDNIIAGPTHMVKKSCEHLYRNFDDVLSRYDTIWPQERILLLEISRNYQVDFIDDKQDVDWDALLARQIDPGNKFLQ